MSETDQQPAPPPEPPDPAGPDEILQATTTRLEAERDEFKDRFLRAEAEMQNLRTRTRKDVEDARQFAVQKFATDVSEAAENLRRGLAALPAQKEGEPDLLTKLRDGFAGVERSFLAILERNGITATDPTLSPFDANLHQAMGEQESAEHPPGTVLQAWTSAWQLNGRLLRPAMVVVSKAPTAGQPIGQQHPSPIA